MRHGLYSVELDPTSFDDLALGGEWTTRRRTISESEIALFAALAGDFSPLAVDTSAGGLRQAPPAMLAAMAVGLGSMDMPIPQVAAWEWASWKFPKPVRAGETIYARWTLTQKRPPVHHSATGIVVWRVDVHTADGAVCAEGEVGASVVRRARAAAAPEGEKPGAAEAAGGPRRRRRRRGSGTGTAAAAPTAEPASAPAAEPKAVPSGSRRRRRKRGGSSGNGGDHSEPAAPAEPAPAPHVPQAAAAGTAPATPVQAAASGAEGRLTRVMRRLRRS